MPRSDVLDLGIGGLARSEGFEPPTF
jgi:hypothetical protein